MDGRNDTTPSCSVPALEPCYSQMICPTNFTTKFHRSIRNQIWQVDALLITEAVLAVIIVWVGAYGQRYRHHPFTRFIFLGATTLFLPIVSFVVSAMNSTDPSYVMIFDRSNRVLDLDPYGLSALVAACQASFHVEALVIWALLVQIVMVNTSTAVATEGREGRRVGPSITLIVQALWTIYLGFITLGHNLKDLKAYYDIFIGLIAPFSLLCAKIVLKWYAFEKARRSFALGRNPGLTFVYMEKLRVQEENQQSQPLRCSHGTPPPPLLVMREEEKQVEIQPHGYALKDDSVTVLMNNNNGLLVTFDKVWQLDSTHQILSPQLKGLCLSFALFKLLRCRFSRYRLTNAETLTFFRSLSLQSREHDRIFRVVADELSFVHDYYYTSIPISYAKCCLPILSILLSLLTMGYCSLLVATAAGNLDHLARRRQLDCNIWWIHDRLVTDSTGYSIGRFFVDMVLLLCIVVSVMIAEVRDMVSYICSNWTKVTLICRYVINHNSSQHSLCLQKWLISLLLRCRCKLIMKQHWNEEMSQCSIMVIHHRTAFVRRLLPLPDQKWKVKVTAAVKVCIVNALRSAIDGGLDKGVSSLHNSQVGEIFLWACNGKGTSDTILVWHIATSIIQVRHRSSGKESDSSEHKTVATQLSQYCAYLVSWCPQLLPDNSAWSKGLYKAVKKDAEGALVAYSMAESWTPEHEHNLDAHSVAAERVADHPAEDQTFRREDGYQKLVRLLSDNSKHEVVKHGVKLGKQLVESMENEETMWKLLAEFWSEMILYLAPSDNLKGHSEAIARGGELITLLWALLFHAGIVSRPGEDDGAAAAAAATAC